ncbi:hypothetical protein M404DRAFT_29177 [Pisolithus tinctorius Marx 270]|uniref:Uncharacterized protein n=1 Tax=Pisolithus tinctorius Marx 270 TaxID=870435 RepID=A0A0C3P0U8_PISTI|nr:hypothetical protein M404DRAFT_29177 [Pisolithus tinctorius Marx 270]
MPPKHDASTAREPAATKCQRALAPANPGPLLSEAPAMTEAQPPQTPDEQPHVSPASAGTLSNSDNGGVDQITCSSATTQTAETPPLPVKDTCKNDISQKMSAVPTNTQPPPNPPSNSIVPTAITNLIDKESVRCYPPQLLSHLRKLSTFTNAQANTYALGLLPTMLTWGKPDPYEDCSKQLCDPLTNQPVTVWVPGHITNVWFMKNGIPDHQCSTTILPLSRAPMLFNSMFDAQELLQAKSTMEKYDPTILSKQDLLLLECHIICYRQKDNNGRWTLFRTQFELQAIHLLHKASNPSDAGNSDHAAEISGLAI